MTVSWPSGNAAFPHSLSTVRPCGAWCQCGPDTSCPTLPGYLAEAHSLRRLLCLRIQAGAGFHSVSCLSFPFPFSFPLQQNRKQNRSEKSTKQKTQALSHLKTNTSLKQLSRAQKRCETTCATRAALRPPVAAYGTKTRPPHRPARKRLEALCSPAPREVSVRGVGSFPWQLKRG